MKPYNLIIIFVIAVIGGGISGLASGFYLRKNNIPFILYDPAPTLGGMINQTTSRFYSRIWSQLFAG